MKLLRAFLLSSCLLPACVQAADAAPAPSVEDNIRAMDRDHDGMVNVSEMRAFLEARHGKDYRRELLDEMEVKAGAKSCASPFSRSLY